MGVRISLYVVVLELTLQLRSIIDVNLIELAILNLLRLKDLPLWLTNFELLGLKVLLLIYLSLSVYIFDALLRRSPRVGITCLCGYSRVYCDFC